MNVGEAMGKAMLGLAGAAIALGVGLRAWHGAWYVADRRAVRSGLGWNEPQAPFRLHGDKWFCSNPDAELAMVLARPDVAPEGMPGVSLFLLPRDRPDGSRNAHFSPNACKGS